MTDLGVEIVPLAAFPHFRDLYGRLADAENEASRAKYAEMVLVQKIEAEFQPEVEPRNEAEYMALRNAAVNARPEKIAASRRSMEAYEAVRRISVEIQALQATLFQRQVEAFEGRRRWVDLKVTAKETGFLSDEEARALESE